jgi:hypothetical protein
MNEPIPTPRTDAIALDIVEILMGETLTQNKDEWVECVARLIRPLERELSQAREELDRIVAKLAAALEETE